MDVLDQARLASDPLDPFSVKITLTVHETALRMGVTDASIYRQLKLGTFPGRARKEGPYWRVLAADVDQLLAVEDGSEPVT